MELKNFLIGILIFGIVITGTGYFASDWAKSMGNNLNNMTQITPVNAIENEIKNMEEAMKSSQITGTWLDIPFVVFSGILSALKLLSITLINIWQTFVSSIAEILHLPMWFVGFVDAIITATLVFTALRVLLNRQTGV